MRKHPLTGIIQQAFKMPEASGSVAGVSEGYHADGFLSAGNQRSCHLTLRRKDEGK
jgi:hypothetical protein